MAIMLDLEAAAVSLCRYDEDDSSTPRITARILSKRCRVRRRSEAGRCFGETIARNECSTYKNEQRRAPSNQSTACHWPWFIILLGLIHAACYGVAAESTPSPLPSSIPISFPTFLPSSFSTLAPSSFPSEAESQESLKDTSLSPSTSPTLSSTENAWVDLLVEKIVYIRLEVPEGNAISLAALASIWQKYLQNTLQSVYRNSSTVRLKQVKIDLSGVVERRRRPELRQRRSLQSMYADLEATVRVSLERHPDETDQDKFLLYVDSLIRSLLEADNLQQALRESNVNSLTVASVEFPKSEDLDALSRIDDNENDDEGPTLTQMIIAFTLLALALASLLFWLRMYLVFRKKKADERKRADHRKAHTFVLPRQERALPAPATPIVIYDGTSDNISERSSFGGISPGSNDDSSSDSFADQLQNAASADEQACRATQKKNGPSRFHASVKANYFPSMLGEWQGGEAVEMEPEADLSYPYGDDDDGVTLLAPSSTESSVESDTVRRPKVSISPARKSHAERTTSWAKNTFSSLRNQSVEKKKVSFEPYGDGETAPMAAADCLSPPGTPERSSEETSGDAVTVSPDSSWSAAGDPQENFLVTAISRPELDETSTKTNNSGSLADAREMINEVAKLSEYMKRYLEQKEKDKSQISELGRKVATLQQEQQQQQQQQQQTVATPSMWSQAFFPLSTSVRSPDSANIQDSDADSSRVDTINSSSDLSMEESMSKDSVTTGDNSTRLGITRFTVPEPPEPLVQNQARVQTAASLPPPSNGSQSYRIRPPPKDSPNRSNTASESSHSNSPSSHMPGSPVGSFSSDSVHDTQKSIPSSSLQPPQSAIERARQKSKTPVPIQFHSARSVPTLRTYRSNPSILDEEDPGDPGLLEQSDEEADE